MTKDIVRSLFVLFIGLLIMSSCDRDQKPKVQELPKSKYADIIRNPLSASGDQDTTNVAKITFNEVLFTFDTIYEGEVIKHTFDFINDGEKPLSISEARSTCGCTVAEYSKGILDPGTKGFVNVSFDSKGKTGFQDKPISVYANTLPQKTVVRMQGFVKPKK